MCGPYNRLRKQARGIAWALLIVNAIGIVLLAAGVGLLATVGNDTRSEKVSVYNAAVDAWLAGTSAAFAGRSLAIRAVPSSGSLTPAPLAELVTTSGEDTSLGASIDPTASDLVDYPARHIRYDAITTKDRPFADVPSYDFMEAEDTVTLQLIDTEGSAGGGLGARVLWSDTVRLSFTQKKLSSSLQCSTGSYKDGYCVTVFLLKSLCYVTVPSGPALPLDAAGGNGCAVLDMASRAQPAALTGATAASGGFLSRTGYAAFPLSAAPLDGWRWKAMGVTIEVRSTFDPFVVALRLTQGSLAFGLSTRQKVMRGVALTSVGGALACVAPCIANLLSRWGFTCGVKAAEGEEREEVQEVGDDDENPSGPATHGSAGLGRGRHGTRAPHAAGSAGAAVEVEMHNPLRALAAAVASRQAALAAQQHAAAALPAHGTVSCSVPSASAAGNWAGSPSVFAAAPPGVYAAAPAAPFVPPVVFPPPAGVGGYTVYPHAFVPVVPSHPHAAGAQHAAPPASPFSFGVSL